ncbi:hypothetical protein [Pseudomonas aeruginosa]|uniref:hypothetical protein n=1 Tax=Pseudomonas aeruginosa TaxID=287 RepID=UPI0021F1331B|nr:hypothetical protein [Pseudomonas aeruginosa]MCV6433203.1 hypothetical protein [Pseudomonas aeruginosa]MCV6440833.1 hypothetical protein [Pseudomonas aeruginosa]
MTMDSNRALRNKIRSEETFCITLVDWRGALDAREVLDRFMKFFADAGRSPSVWLASSGPDQRMISGQPEIERALREKAAACFELTLTHERADVHGTWDVSCFFYDANSEHEQTKGLSCLQMAASSSLIEDTGSVSESIARFVAESAEFAYGYAFTAAYGLDLETYGPGLATSGALCPDLEDPYAWPRELRQAMSAHAPRPHQDGKLRFLYPRNFLSESLLRMRIDEVDLETWIQDERMGYLKRSAPNLWTWDLNQAEQNAARLALGQRGKLVAFRNLPRKIGSQGLVR